MNQDEHRPKFTLKKEKNRNHRFDSWWELFHINLRQSVLVDRNKNKTKTSRMAHIIG